MPKLFLKTMVNLLEGLFLGVRPHVDKLALVVDEQRVRHQAVLVHVLPLAVLGRQQGRRHDGVRMHFLLFQLGGKQKFFNILGVLQVGSCIGSIFKKAISRENY